jgi:hypothetical protein
MTLLLLPNIHFARWRLICFYIYFGGQAVVQLVEALRKMPEGRSLIPDGVIGVFHYLNPSGCTMTSNRSDYQEYPSLCRAGKLATYMSLEILESSNSWSPKFLPKSTVLLLLYFSRQMNIKQIVTISVTI